MYSSGRIINVIIGIAASIDVCIGLPEEASITMVLPSISLQG